MHFLRDYHKKIGFDLWDEPQQAALTMFIKKEGQLALFFVNCCYTVLTNHQDGGAGAAVQVPRSESRSPGHPGRRRADIISKDAHHCV